MRKYISLDWKNWSLEIGIDTFYNQILCISLDYNHGDGHIMIEFLRFGIQLIYWDKKEYYRDRGLLEG